MPHLLTHLISIMQRRCETYWLINLITTNSYKGKTLLGRCDIYLYIVSGISHIFFMTAMIYSFRSTTFHHVNTKRRFNFPLVTVLIIYVPCNLLSRRPSAAADLSVDRGATRVLPAPHRGHSARTCTRTHPRTHANTHTTKVNTSPVPTGDLIILYPAQIANLVA